MRIKQIYIADDDKEFETEEECKAYEENIEFVNMAQKLQDWCGHTSCTNCPFHATVNECAIYEPHIWDI